LQPQKSFSPKVGSILAQRFVEGKQQVKGICGKKSCGERFVFPVA
jgi:hypothetical protein